jgi:hypothetical protein
METLSRAAGGSNVEPLQHLQNTSVLATNDKMVVVSHPHYSPNLAPCDFILFPEMKQDMLTLQKFNENCWRPLTTFMLKNLDNVSSSGSSAGIVASSHRRSTLKGTKFSNLYEYCK